MATAIPGNNFKLKLGLLKLLVRIFFSKFNSVGAVLLSNGVLFSYLDGCQGVDSQGDLNQSCAGGPTKVSKLKYPLRIPPLVKERTCKTKFYTLLFHKYVLYFKLYFKVRARTLELYFELQPCHEVRQGYKHVHVLKD